MKKTFKKIAGLLLAMIMVLAMTVPAFAAGEGNCSISINNAMGHYNAYQIFTGTISGDGTDANPYVIADIVWGSGISDAGKAAMGDAAAKAKEVETAAKADDFAAALVNGAENTIYLETVAADADTDSKTKTATLSGLTPGYYLVVNDKIDSEKDAYSKYIVQVVNKNLTISNKTDVPSIEKKVKNNEEEDSAYRDANNVAIGDTVNYQITSKVPDMSNYTHYYFVVDDHLSKGLAYNTEQDLSVKVGGKKLEAGTDYTLTVEPYDASKGTDIEIVFKNFYNKYKDQSGAAIVIEYSATLNAKAAVGSIGNPNSVELTYSNNPNEAGSGDKPEDNEVVGKTPKDWTVTYTTQMKIKKVDASTKAPLAGAEFTMSGYKMNDKITYTEVYTEDTNGSFYKLTDGTYTTTAPTSLTADNYVKTKTKYTLTVKKDETTTATPVTVTCTTDSKGEASIGSLAAGKYIFTEAKAPAGYNMLKEAITVIITCNSNGLTVNDKTDACTWTVEGAEFDEDDPSMIVLTVENSKGATLPSTGGMGTRIFTVSGLVIMIGAALLLVTKKRMSIRK